MPIIATTSRSDPFVRLSSYGESHEKWTFVEEKMGRLEKGLWADVTVMDIDPDNLLDGSILLTVANGRVVYRGQN